MSEGKTDRWDEEARKALAHCPECVDASLSAEEGVRVASAAALARRAYREGLERAIAAIAESGIHIDGVCIHDYCRGARKGVAAIRREIDGA